MVLCKALSPWFSSSWSSLCSRICVVDPSHCPSNSCPSHCPSNSCPSYCPSNSCLSHCPSYSCPSHCPSNSCPSHCWFGLGFKYGADKKALRCRFEVYHGSAQAHRAVCTCHTRDNFVNLRCSCWEETLLQMRAFAEGVKIRDVLFFLLLLFFPANALIVANFLCCWMFWSCFVL